MAEKRRVVRDQQAATRKRGGYSTGTRLTEAQKQVMREVVQRRRKVHEELAKH